MAAAIPEVTTDFVKKHSLEDGRPKLVQFGDSVSGSVREADDGTLFMKEYGGLMYKLSKPGEAGYVLDNVSDFAVAHAWRWVRFHPATGRLFCQSFGTRCDRTRHKTGFLNAWFPFLGVDSLGLRIYEHGYYGAKSEPFAGWKRPILGKFMDCNRVVGWAMNFSNELDMKTALGFGWRDIKLDGASPEDAQTFDECMLVLATKYQLVI